MSESSWWQLSRELLLWRGIWQSDPLSSVCVLPEVVCLNPHCSNSFYCLKSCMKMSFYDTIDLCGHNLKNVSSVSHGDERWNNDAVLCFNELTWTGYAAALWSANYDDQDKNLPIFNLCTRVVHSQCHTSSSFKAVCLEKVKFCLYYFVYQWNLSQLKVKWQKFIYSVKTN